MPSYISTYIVNGNEISIDTDGTQALSVYIGEAAYMYISNNGSYYVIDLAKYMLFESNIDYTVELETLASSLTDLQIAGYTNNIIPFIDQNTGGFTNRLNVYDAYITSDVTVSYTSIDTPDIINDIYQRDQLNDLVITTTSRDFSNCLVSVNGVFQFTYYFNNALYVLDGFSNIKNSKKNKIAIYDTTDLGGHVIVPITMANIDSTNTDPFSGVTLTFPNTDFTGTTVLLVFAGYLYALDDRYRLININRMMIDICKIDLLDQFLHDPNTRFKVDTTIQVASDTTNGQNLDVVDEITYYLQSVYPSASANVVAQTDLLNFSFVTSSAANSTISTAEMINSFLTNFPFSIPNNGTVMFGAYEDYEAPSTITTSLPMTDFTNPRWVYALLTQANSFLIVLKNSTIYKRVYYLNRTEIPSQYVEYSPDTPRGILQYDYNRSLPYLLYAESNHKNYNFSIDYSKICKDVFKTAINPTYVPAPPLDVKWDMQYPVRLLELYSPNS